MKPIVALLILGCIVSPLSGQWVEKVIPLPDSLPKMSTVPILFHAPNNTIYVSGQESRLMAIDPATNTKLDKVMEIGPGPHHYMSSNPTGNKIYCANTDYTLTVIDAANNQPIKTITVGHRLSGILYNEEEDKLYCASADSLLTVIDCARDSVVARIAVGSGFGDLCYNPGMNRVYWTHSSSDEVTVIDCAADTAVATIWVRGVAPSDICYDSASNCVYTANTTSGSVSVIDCSGDTLTRVVPVGDQPEFILAGPPGKVYCTNYYDSTVSVISAGGVKTVRTARHPYTLSYDPANNKVYCTSDYDDIVTVIDASADTVLAQVGTGSSPWGMCYDPVRRNTYVTCASAGVVEMIGGQSDSVEAAIAFGAVVPQQLCYNSLDARLYCAGQGLLWVIDGNSHDVRRMIPIHGRSIAGLLWNQFRDKLYICVPDDRCLYVLDCATDKIVGRVPVGWRISLMCYNSTNDKIYVAASYGSRVAVIDCAADTVAAVVELGSPVYTLAWNSVSNRVYCMEAEVYTVAVIDCATDVVSTLIPLPDYPFGLLYIPTHNKLYVSDYGANICVVDGAGDSLLTTILTSGRQEFRLYDSANDRVYAEESPASLLNVWDPGSDTLVAGISIGGASSVIDNGRTGDANRVYCTSTDENKVYVISGAADTVVRAIGVGSHPAALALNPAHNWVYVANLAGSSITVLSDTALVGIAASQPHVSSHKPQATVVSGVLFLPSASGAKREVSSVLLDISGRKELDLHAGANDVHTLAPGVYFVREAQAQAQAVRKIVITR